MKYSDTTPITRELRNAKLPIRASYREAPGRVFVFFSLLLFMLSSMNSLAFSYTFSDNSSNSTFCNHAFEGEVSSSMALVLTETHVDVSCFGLNDGRIDLTISGGIPPIVIDWDNDGIGDNDDTEDLLGLAPNTYIVNVTDATSIPQTISVTISEPAILASTTAGTDVTINGFSNGQADITASGGTAPYTYLWTGGSTNDTLFNAAAGKHYITVTDFNGCSALDSITLTEPDALGLTMSQSDVSCNAGNDGQADVSVTGGVAPYTYLWTGGNTNDTLFNASAGKHYITVTDVNGASKLDSVTLTEPALLTTATAGTNVTINGFSNGQADVTASGGTAPYTYLWTGGSTNDTLFNAAAGKHYITVTDFNGCSALDSITLTEPDPLALTLSHNDVSCNAGNDGQADVAVTGGVAPYTFLWTGGSTNDTLFNASAGKHYITVTDFNGASRLDSVTLTEPALLTTATAGTNVTINGFSNGQADVTASGGTAPYTYLWTGGSINDTLFNAAAGKHYITVIDFNGCSALDSITLTEPDPLALTLSQNDVSCNAGNDGQADVAVTGGVAPYTYLWTGGSTNDTLFNATAQKYYITVTDFNGAIKPDSITIAEPANLMLTAAPYTTYGALNISCYGASNGGARMTSITGGTAPYSYAWSNGQLNDSLIDVIAGTYTLTVNDSNLCTTSADITLTEPDTLKSLLSIDIPIDCFGAANGEASASISGGATPYAFVWNGGAGTDAVTGLSEGWAVLEVTDDNGCMLRDSIYMAQPDSLSFAVATSNNLCNGASTGTIDFTVIGGTSLYSFDWDNDGVGDVDDTEDLSNLAAGDYRVYVTDSNGCAKDTIISISEPLAIAISESHQDITCFSTLTGSIDISVLGGLGPYTFDWDTDVTGDFDDGEDLIGLGAGNYQVVVRDANGCKDSLSILLTQPDTLQVTSTLTNLSCDESGNGAINVSVSDGTAPYTFDWDTDTTGDFDDTEDLTGLDAGTYVLEVKDANLCEFTSSFTLTQPDTLDIIPSYSMVSCNGGSNGAIGISIAGGTAPYTYDWAHVPGVNNLKDIINRTAGDYTLTVTDAMGCIFSEVFTITEPTALSILETHTEVSCNGGMDGALNISVSGGIIPYTYDWDTDALGDFDDNEDLSGLSAGNYTVVVKDVNGCTINTTVSISEPLALMLSASPSSPLCTGAANGSIDLSVSGGTSPYAFDWDTNGWGVTPDAEDQSGLSSGTYGVIVTDAYDCKDTLFVVVTDPVLLTLSATQTDVKCFGGNDGSIDLTFSGGTAPYMVDWDDDGTGDTDDFQDISGLSKGTYTVVVLDDNGCTATMDVVISEPSELFLSRIPSEVSCFGGANGEIDLNVSGGIAPYQFDWNVDGTGDFDDIEDLVGLSSGLYAVTVKDANDCIKTTSVTINEPTGLSFSETHINPSCFGGANGSIDVTIAGGTAPYVYDWDTDGIGDYDDAEDLTALNDGMYTLFVRDAKGCQLDTAIAIVEPSDIVVSETHANVTCAGDSDASIDITVTGGTPNAMAPFYQYDWDHIPGVNNSEDLFGLADGTYKVIITDANACQDSISVIIGTTSTILLSATQADAACFGDATGGIDLVVNGTGLAPFIYDWDNNGIGVFSAGTTDSQDLIGLTAGDYSVIVSDATGCSETLTATVGQSPVLQANMSFTSTSCTSLIDATATAIPTGGDGSYSYDWSTGGNSNAITGLSSGTYYVTITDGNACAVLDSVIISHIDLLSLVANVNSDYTGSDISCPGGSDGFAIAVPSGGVGPFSYSWDDPLSQTGAALNSVEQGTYNVTVTDSRACSTTASVTLNDPLAMVTTIALTSPYTGGGVSCNGASDAAIALTVLNGALPLEYDWDIDGTGDFDDPDNLSGLPAGIYNVTVRDANGCIASDAITITEPALLTGSLIASDYNGFNVSCNGGVDGQLTANMSGGSSPYSYSWNGAAATANNSISGLSVGYNEVVVTDANNCAVTLSTSLTGPSAISLTITTAAPTDCDVDNGIINIEATGGVGSYMYSNDNGSTWQNLNYFTGLATGSYSVVVSNGLGTCQTALANVVIDAAEAPQIDNLTIINPTGAVTTDGAVLVDASGNGLSLQFSIDGGAFQSSNLFSGLVAGAHSVCVRYVGQVCTSCQPFTMSPGGGVVGASSDTEICSQKESLTGFVETYYIPMPEDLMLSAYQSIYDVSTCGSSGSAPVGPMHSYNSIGVVETGTKIHFDHWEVDGYEANLAFPVQSSTEIWGDNDPTNGIPPGFAVDLLNAGDIIVLQSTIDVNNLNAIDYDGGDKFGSKGDLSYSKMTWASGSGTFLAGAAEVFPVEKWATDFIVPIGEDTDVNNMFSYTGATIIAMTDGTSIVVNNGGSITNITLNEGESELIDGGLDAGTTITSTEPVQVQLITGDRCETFESRFYTLTSRDLWSDHYYNPVTSEPNRDTYVHFYNPNPVDITVYMERSGGFVSSYLVTADGTNFADLPETSGTRFYTTDGRDFYATATVHSNGSANGADWGYALLPNTLLSGQITLVGFAPGENPLNPDGGNYSPIWITGDHPNGSAFDGDQITIYVDYDGDGGVNIDANGSQYDQLFLIDELGKLKIFDPDGDQTGMKIWVGDASDAFIAGAFGQDPSLEVGGNTAQLDLGTGVFNRIPFSASLCVDLYTDFLNNNVYDECDEVIYTASIHNTGSLPLAASSLNLIDTLSSAISYVPNTTFIYAPSGITQIPDDVSPDTPFPLDQDGSQVTSVIQPGDSILVKWVSTINDASTASFIQNIAYVENANTALDPEVSFPVQNPTSVSIPSIPADINIACDDAIASPPFQDTCLTTIFISNAPWTKHFVSSEDSATPTPGELAFDDDPDTYWISENPGWANPYPHEFQIDMGEVHLNVLGVRYMPRQDASTGRISNYELYTSLDGSSWTLQKSGSFDGSADFADIEFSAVDARYIRLRALTPAAFSLKAAIAELSVFRCGNSVVFNETSTQTSDGTCTEFDYSIDRSWTVTNHCGNVGTQSQTITVEDNEAPVINGVPADNTYTNGNVPAPPTLTATDNCATVTVVYTADTVMIGCNRQITRTWTSTDPCGNAASEEQVIIELTCPEICDDGIDNDGDGLIDCADDECFNSLTIELGDNAKICEGEAIDIDAVVSGGHAPYIVSWDNGLPNGLSNTVSPTSNTTYTATVSDQFSCSTSDDVFVRVNSNQVSGMVFNNLGGADVTIADGAIYNLSTLPGNFNLQALHTHNNGSVELSLTGPIAATEIDNSAAYILGTDASPMMLVEGDYCFTAMVFARNNANGPMCDSVTVCFTIIDNEICDDGIDNDGDGLIDCQDPDCAAFDFDSDTVCDVDDLDDDNDGILDIVEGNVDTDSDGFNNTVDYDSDGDGCPDVVEAGFTDQNGDNILANLPIIVDADGLVLGTDSVDGYATPADDNGNGTYDFLEATTIDITCPSDSTVYLSSSCEYALGDFRSLASVIGACRTYTVSQSPAIGTLYGVSDRTITLIATDDLGNSTSCSFQVSIRDNTPPVAVCQDITVYLNGAGLAVISPAMIENGSTDNCEVDTRSLDIASVNCSHVGGLTPVELTVSDASGNTGTCSASITVLDTIAPTISCPSNITRGSDDGVCGAVVNFPAPLGADNCAGVVTNRTDATGLNSGDLFPIGTTLIEYTVTDASGNTANCSFNITVNDIEAPEINCPGAITVSVTPGTCGAMVNYLDPTITDNCLGATLSQVDATGLSAGSVFPVGTTTLVYRVTDLVGNTTNCSFTITVIDNENPSISCPADISVGNSPGLCGAIVNYTIPTALDNCPGFSIAQIDASGLSSGDEFPLGTTTLTYRVTDAAGNTATCSFDISVSDTEAPYAACQTTTLDLGGGTVTLNPLDVFDALSSSDNCPSVSAVSVNPNTFTTIGTYPVTLTVEDAAGNTSTCSLNIQIIDSDPPVCSTQDITVQLDINGGVTISPSDIDDGSTDNGVIDSYVLDVNAFDCSDIGVNPVELTLTDDAGNSTVCSANVTVEDINAPVISCRDITVQLDASGLATITAGQLDDGTTDNCGFTLSADITSFDCDDTGANNVVLTATDPSGNSSSCTAVVTVEDLIIPDLDCTSPIIVGNDPGVCGAEITYSLPAVTDNCSASIVAQLITGAGHSSGSIFPIGVSFVGYSAANPYNGQTVTCTFPVTVTDTELPTITCPSDITVNSNAGICGAVVNYTAPVGTDNCTATTLQTDATGLSSGSTFPVGTTALEYTVTDASGNTATCSFTVTVVDIVTPMVIGCPSDITANTDAGVCGAEVNYTAPSATDNCSVMSVTQTDGTGFTSGDIFPVGSTQQEFTIMDGAGNTSICSFTITVIDNEDPVAVCQTVTLNLGGGTVTLLPADVFNAAASNDNCPTVTPISVTPNTFSAIGTYTVTLTVEDESGNTDECTVDITVEDTTPPVPVCLPAGINAYLDAFGDVTIQGIDLDNGSTDNGTIVSYQAVPSDFDCSDLGVNPVTLIVTDDGGNTSSCSTTVTVLDTIAPTAMCQTFFLALDNNGQASITPAMIDNGSFDNCSIDTYSLDITDFDCSNVGGNQVTLTVTDVSGNSSQCQVFVSVLEVEFPTISCPADIIQSTDAGLATATVVVPVPITDDNCGVQSVVNDFNGTSDASDVYPNGTTTVSWTVTDVNGNVATCDMTVTIEDTSPPDPDCQADVNVDATIGACEVAVTIPVPNPTDNDGIASIVNDYNNTEDASDIYPAGPTTVTWTVTDNNGNTAICEQLVFVNDVEAPTVSSCPADTLIDATLTECGIDAALVALGSPVATDPCGIVNISNDAPLYYPVGITSVTWSIADTSGNSSTCLQLVTIEDVENPTVTFCPADVVVENDLGICGTALANVLLGMATGADPCGDPVITNDAPSIFPVGQTTVTWYLEDINGNVDSTCTQLVTVIDAEAPIITECPVAMDFDATMDECGIDAAIVTLGTLTATDNCGFVVTSNDAPAYFPVGQTVVTWTVLDGVSNSSTCTQIITINDIQAVTNLICPADTTITASIGACGIDAAIVTLNEPTATDACGVVNITNDAPVFYPVGETIVTWTIADTSGNVLNCTQVVTIIDEELPTLTACPSDVEVNVDDSECGTALVNVALGNPTATDPCGIAFIENNAPDTFLVGVTTVVWTITDSNGNTSFCSQQVTVIDDEAPIILDCPDTVDVDATIDECGSDSLLVDLGTLSAEDPCGIDTIFNNGQAYYPVGQTTVTWTVLDNNGQISNCEQIVTIHDVQAPVNLLCPEDTVITATIGACGVDAAVVTLNAPTAEDACGVVIITNDAPIFYPVGETLVTWTIADTSGNALNCIQLVTIMDEESPTMTFCPSDIEVSNDLGICGAVVNYVLPEAVDPCGIGSVTLVEGLLSGEEFPIGLTTVSYELEDVNGNVSICTFNVTINDDEAPVFATPVVFEYEALEGQCESLVSFNIPVGTDNCLGTTTIQTDLTGLLSGDIFPVGVTQLCYLATDASGNETALCIDVEVLDIESPVIVSCPEDIVLAMDEGTCGAFYMPSPPAATDNCGDVIFTHDGPMIYPVGNTLVTWTISDDADNTVYCYQNITVNDDELPVIICPDDVALSADWGACDTYVEVGLSITEDNCAVDSVWNDFNGTADASGIYPLGETIVTWTVLDANGNTATCAILISVSTPGDPVIDCPEDIEVTAAEGLCEQTIIVPQVIVDNPCSVVSIVNDYTGSDNASGTYPVGVTVITWTITDISGNVSECSMTVTVIDDQLPSIVCPADISVSNDPGICGAYVFYDLPIVEENCAIDEFTMTSGVEPNGLFSIGTTEVSYLVSDVWGNSALCSFEVSVSDDEAPVITCPDNIVQVDSIVSYAYPNYSDNCYAELILIDGPDSGDEFDHGITEVFFAAVDLNGNMDTCSFQVLVNTPPVAVNDTVTIFESDDNITIDILGNDYDVDGDSIFVIGLLHYGDELAVFDDGVMYFNIPDDECGIDSVSYIIMDEYGATDTATVFVDVTCHPTVFVPEGFSPNGDGVNDVLHILGLHEFPNNKLMVFNRWGHKVYERENYQNDWSGRSEAELTIGLTLLPRATYYYLLDLGEGNIKPLKGFFYINPQ